MIMFFIFQKKKVFQCSLSLHDSVGYISEIVLDNVLPPPARGAPLRAGRFLGRVLQHRGRPDPGLIRGAQVTQVQIYEEGLLTTCQCNTTGCTPASSSSASTPPSYPLFSRVSPPPPVSHQVLIVQILKKI